jgi:molecular chaperone DnaK
VVLQGEGPDVADCEYLGTLHLTGLPAGPRGMIKIAITFEVGAEGLLKVSAREQHSHREVRAVMSTRDGTEAIRRKLASQGPEAVQPPRSSSPPPPPAELTPPPEAIPARRPASAISEQPAADPPRRRGLFRRFFE